jgi:CheY-like chemotaxis protein
MNSPAVRCDIQIDLGCSAAICGEIGDRLRISLKSETKGLPQHMMVLVEQIAQTDGGRPSFAPLQPASPHPGKRPVMMVLDRSSFPAVILVVEDEMLLRMRAVDMVEDAGYTPIEAIDADQAVAILESRSDIALLFTDIQMPGSMDGVELAHSVHERWPPIKIILVSGQLKLSTSDIPPDSRFFGKPLEAREMIAEMREMIGHA